MRLTVGMASYNNFTEVFFTIQALRMYQNLSDAEILIIDNFGDPELEKFVTNQGQGIVRYERCTDNIGPAYAKNEVFVRARGETVLCIDSHVMLVPGALDKIPVTDDLIQGPLVYCDLRNIVTEWKPVWRGHMWGIWGDYCTYDKLPKEPFEIWGCGGGLYLTKKSSWLGFNPKFKGFGGEEGYIHEKYRKAGRKVLCHPNLIWMHMFDRKIPYPLNLMDRVVNYIIGFKEIGLDLKPVQEHFGEALYCQALLEAEKR